MHRNGRLSVCCSNVQLQSCSHAQLCSRPSRSALLKSGVVGNAGCKTQSARSTKRWWMKKHTHTHTHARILCNQIQNLPHRTPTRQNQSWCAYSARVNPRSNETCSRHAFELANLTTGCTQILVQYNRGCMLSAPKQV